MELTLPYPAVCNIKFRFKVSENCGNLKNERLFKNCNWSNYYTIRFPSSKLAYIIFPSSGAVNITGVDNFELVEEALRNFNRQFNTQVKLSDVSIDNSTAAGQLPLSEGNVILLQSVKRVLENPSNWDVNERVFVSLTPSCFPAAVIRRKFKEQKLPTLLLFGNGKYSIVGAKSKQELTNTYNWICANTRQLMMTTEQGIPFACSVD